MYADDAQPVAQEPRHTCPWKSPGFFTNCRACVAAFNAGEPKYGSQMRVGAAPPSHEPGTSAPRNCDSCHAVEGHLRTCPRLLEDHDERPVTAREYRWLHREVLALASRVGVLESRR